MIEVLFLKRAETRDLALSPIDFKIFLIFLDFLRSLLKPFGAKFLVLEIKPRFTCAESTLKLKLKVLQSFN